MDHPPDRLYGWGYAGHSVDDLVAFAQTRGVHAVVDVRLNPVSRKRGFSKRLLAAALEDAGLAYVHLPALGNPRDNRDGFAAAGLLPTGGQNTPRTRNDCGCWCWFPTKK